MKRIVSIVLCLCMLLPVLTGCEMNVTLKEGVPIKGQTEQTGNNGGTGGGDLDLSGLDIPKEITEFWANYDWDNFDPADLIEPLGDATFTLDESATATGEFTPGKPLTLSVTDSAGATWTLEVPENALLYEETITMTAMRDVKLDGEKLDGGVQLSPDGLTFLAPATLTVKSNSYYFEGTNIFQGDHNGGGVTYVAYETDMGSLTTTATIWHFSYVVYGNGYDGSPIVFYNPDTGNYKIYPDGLGDPPYVTDEAGFDEFVNEQALKNQELERKIEEAKREEERRKAEEEAAEKERERKEREREEREQKAEQEDWDQFDKKALAQFKKVIALAYEIYNKPLKVPTPPSNTLKCDGNHSGKSKNNNFDKQFMEPEWPAIQALDAAFFALLGSYKGVEGSALALIIETYTEAKTMLRDRLLEKAKQLIDTYKYQEDRFLDVALAWIVTKAASLTIGFGGAEIQRLDAEMKKWAKEVWNDLMRDVVEKHDYRQANHLAGVALVGAFAVGDFGIGNNFQTYLANALTFEVRHNIDYNGDGTIFYKMSGSTTVKMDQITEAGISGSKAGTGNYDSATAEAMTHDGPSSYDQTVKLSDFDPCSNKTITAGFSVFGAASENWHETESGMNIPVTFPGMVYMGFYAYAKNNIDQDTGGFKFELPLQNMSAQAADETFFWSGEVVFSLDVILTHTPEGEVYIK